MAAGEEIVAGVMIRPPLSCVKQSATSGPGQCRLQGTGARLTNGGGNQRRQEGFDSRKRLQVNGRKKKRGERWEMLMHVVGE